MKRLTGAAERRFGRNQAAPGQAGDSRTAIEPAGAERAQRMTDRAVVRRSHRSGFVQAARTGIIRREDDAEQVVVRRVRERERDSPARDEQEHGQQPGGQTVKASGDHDTSRVMESSD